MNYWIQTLFALTLSGFAGCKRPTMQTTALDEAKRETSSSGLVEFLSTSSLKAYKDALPAVKDEYVQATLKDPKTIWYDEQSMKFVYQDSVETVTGVRHNSVGYEVGMRNRNNPGIHRLVNYFQEGKFKFPFAGVAGTDNVTNVESKNFWSPARRSDGSVIPVRWWRNSKRGRWNWVHPVGTIFGEVLYQRSSDGALYVFEIRIREKYQEGWDVDVFRPFANAQQMADAIVQLRPQWQSSANLRNVMQHLKNPRTLTRHTLASPAYEKLFKPIQGAIDWVPRMKEEQLVKDLLSKVPFQSVKGRAWKRYGSLETYAPGSLGEFGIVPKGYELGMIEVNEASCNRCHESTGVQLGHLDPVVQLYGEVWGEDRIFTWHLFEPNKRIYGTFDERDGSRIINQKLVKSGLVVEGKPNSQDRLYPVLPAQLPWKF